MGGWYPAEAPLDCRCGEAGPARVREEKRSTRRGSSAATCAAHRGTRSALVMARSASSLSEQKPWGGGDFAELSIQCSIRWSNIASLLLLKNLKGASLVARDRFLPRLAARPPCLQAQPSTPSCAPVDGSDSQRRWALLDGFVRGEAARASALGRVSRLKKGHHGLGYSRVENVGRGAAELV